MSTSLFLFLTLVGQIMAKKPPDLQCMVINLEYVNCSWNLQETPDVNYTFSSRFEGEDQSSCAEYLLENGINIGCRRPYNYTRRQRFDTFYTKLSDGSQVFQKELQLKTKVKLNPPTNLTVKNGSDFNLWFYWNQTNPKCVDSEVRIRINNSDWEILSVFHKQSYCQKLPSSSSRYELQVRSKLKYDCGDSEYWSDWSEPVVWGFNNTTDTNIRNNGISVWTAVLYAAGATTLILLVMILLHSERIKIILIPPLPKPVLNSPDVEDWFHFPKGLIKDGFNSTFNERACTVSEYQPVSRSDSNGSDSSNLTTSTDQTDCSITIAGDGAGLKASV
ncbi:PREDICTED: cytokine receptor common subunit gamma-like isoform X3 [Cyprinodon variegatus]|uniref:cytokine receptor common subunit gamma-like isoform X3 n=1 Tax=Cyprinodon variegatus TaxID=28743 RepID=UPI0007429CC4|nr:PREDICTED: cytokine receptor common subunit gamma-like isoform X3 [Cyprinodon variegatus]